MNLKSVILSIFSGITAMLCLFSINLYAHQFRAFQEILTPQSEQRQLNKLLPKGAIFSQEMQPVEKLKVEAGIRKLVESWNSPAMQETLAAEFYDRSRLLDAIQGKVPRDAKLRLQAIRGLQTLQQYQLPEDGKRVSIVSATASTQIEYNSSTGFVRLPGVNEFILKITEPMNNP